MFKFIIITILLLLFSQVSYTDPVVSSAWMNSPHMASQINIVLVCKIQVLSVHKGQAIKNRPPSGNIRNASDVYQMNARAKVLSVIKGECPDVIEIEFEEPMESTNRFGIPNSQLYPKLSENEICIVFLRTQYNMRPGSEDSIILNNQEPQDIRNILSSKLKCVPKVIEYNLGNTTNMKLVCEFLDGSESDDEVTQLHSVCQLGYLAEEIISGRLSRNLEPFDNVASALRRIQQALNKTQQSKIFSIRSVSYIATFQADGSLDIEGPLQLLRMDPAEFDKNDSLKKYETQSFSVSNLQLRLIETMDSTTRRSVFDMNDGSTIRTEDGFKDIYRGLRGFNYTGFFNQALDCESVKISEQKRTAIANVLWIRCERKSAPVIVRLLDDTNSYVRQTAVSALRKCINSDTSNSWEPKDFYSNSPPRTLDMGRGEPEKSLEERQKDYRDNEQEYIKYWKDWWQKNKTDFTES